MSDDIGTFTPEDETWMRAALCAAANGEGRVSPNPPVGCVIVKNGRALARGWHDRLGGLHAEAMALREAGEDARGSSVYVTLSPCTSHGRQPPCSEALIRAGVAEVFIAATDPNPGNRDGAEALAAAGVRARTGLLRAEAEYLARGFFSMMRRKTPFVTLKYAMTLDGRIATASGDSRWVSGEASREVVQDMRSRHDAILVGSGTALADNPLLNVRGRALAARGGELHRQPMRVIVDSRCRMPPEAAVFDPSAGCGGPALVACARGANPEGAKALVRAGARLLEFESADGRVPLAPLLAELGALGADMVLCEGGGELAASLLREGLVDEIAAFVAPKIVGGREAPGPVGGGGALRMADALPFRLSRCETVGEDVLLVLNPGPGAPGAPPAPNRGRE